MVEHQHHHKEGERKRMMMKGKTFCFIFLILILMTLIIPCLGAAPKKGGKQSNSKPAAPVNKQKEKDKQAKKEIREYVCLFLLSIHSFQYFINSFTRIIHIFIVFYYSILLSSLIFFSSFFSSFLFLLFSFLF